MRASTSDKVALIADNLASNEGVDNNQLHLISLPANTTAMFQPLGAGVIQALKMRYKNVGGSAIALPSLLSGDLGATQCGAPSKPQPTTWNGRSGIWRHNCLVRMACPTAKTTRIKLTRPSPRLV